MHFFCFNRFPPQPAAAAPVSAGGGEVPSAKKRPLPKTSTATTCPWALCSRFQGKNTTIYTPGDSRLEHVLMEVWFRSFSFLFKMGDGCRFQPLIFQGVNLRMKWRCFSFLKFLFQFPKIQNKHVCFVGE